MFSNTKVICILGNILAIIDAVTNQGKQFIVVFEENDIYNSGPPEPVHLLITTFLPYDVIVNVTSHPTIASAVLVNKQFTVNSAIVKKLAIDRYFRMDGNELSKKGILVEASDDITVYGFNREKYSVDAFLVLPVHGLGTEYYAVSYFPPSSGAQLQVAAVYDDTNVTIQLSNNTNAASVVFQGLSYAPGDYIILSLNKLDTLQLQTMGELSGTYISSRKPIAVFSGNIKTKIGSNSNSDHMADQLRPVGSWGKQFVLTSNAVSNNEDIYKFIASTLSTLLTFECTGISSFTKNLACPGDFVDVGIPNNINCFVTASQPVSVAQMSKDTDPSMIIIPPVEQYLESYHFANPSFDNSGYSLYVQVVIDKSKRTGLRLNGKAIALTSTMNSFAIGKVAVSKKINTLSHTDGSVKFGAFLYGKGSYEIYSTAAGINLTTINAASPSDVYNPSVTNSVDMTTTTTEPTSTSSSTTTTTTMMTTTTTAASTITGEQVSSEGVVTTTVMSSTANNPTTSGTTSGITSGTTSGTTQVYEQPSTQCPSTQTQGTGNSSEYCDIYICFNFTKVDIASSEKDLRILKKDTTMYKRSLVSVEDNRPSARAIGLSGGAIIAIVVLGLVLADLPNLKAMLILMMNNCGLSTNKKRRSKA